MAFLQLSDTAAVDPHRIESYHVSTPKWDGYEGGPRISIYTHAGKEWYFFGTMVEFKALLDEALEPF